MAKLNFAMCGSATAMFRSLPMKTGFCATSLSALNRARPSLSWVTQAPARPRSFPCFSASTTFSAAKSFSMARTFEPSTSRICDVNSASCCRILFFSLERLKPTSVSVPRTSRTPPLNARSRKLASANSSVRSTMAPPPVSMSAAPRSPWASASSSISRAPWPTTRAS